MSTEVIGGADTASHESVSRSERQVGPETRAVRIFREVFAQDAHTAGHLMKSLDRYLKLVIEDPDAKRGDKTYARKIYADLSRQFRGETVAIPEYAKNETNLSDKDIQEILSATDTPPLTITTSSTNAVQAASVTLSVAPTVDEDPLDEILVPVEQPDPPVVLQCKSFLSELMASNKLPFLKVFQCLSPGLDGNVGHVGRYLALGTVMGTVTHGKHMGKSVNIHCTVLGYRKLRDAERDHAVFVKGRALVVSDDDQKTGLRKHIFCLRHTPGMKIRYWTRINDRDEPTGAHYYVCTRDGVQEITREQFQS